MIKYSKSILRYKYIEIDNNKNYMKKKENKNEATNINRKSNINNIYIIIIIINICICIWNHSRKNKRPRVVGEILGGMILGGSCLFILFPSFMRSIFFAYPEEGHVLNIFYQLGLIFLMFLSGYNTEVKIDKKNIKTITLVFIGATIIPMICAIPFISFFKNSFIGLINNNFAFSIVFCISIAITSIPVISKIFFDLKIMNTKFSNTILTIATF